MLEMKNAPARAHFSENGSGTQWVVDEHFTGSALVCQTPEFPATAQLHHIPVKMTGRQMIWLIHLIRRISRKRLNQIVQRLGLGEPLSEISRQDAGRLIAELRRAAGGRR